MQSVLLFLPQNQVRPDLLASNKLTGMSGQPSSPSHYKVKKQALDKLVSVRSFRVHTPSINCFSVSLSIWYFQKLFFFFFASSMKRSSECPT